MRATLLAILLLFVGCDDGWHEGDPVDRAVTAWRLVPGLADTRVAITLEPRKIHRDEQGVLTLGYSTQLVGPSIAVENDTQVATLDVGSTEVRVGATRAWILQTALDFWEHQSPGSAPPRSPFVSATVIDRSTFAMTEVALSPPIGTPIVIGDALLDVSASGASDIERDVFVRLRTDDGGATVLTAGRGFGAAVCARSGGVVLVVQLASGDLRIVSVRPDGGSWRTTEASLLATQFDPLGIACNEGATHVALVVPGGITLVDILAGSTVLHLDGAQRPMVVRSDGSALVASRTEDRALVFADATGPHTLAAVSAKDPEPPKVAGDLAMFELEAAVVVVDLGSGTLGTTIPAIRDYMYPFEMIRWRDKFVVELSIPSATYQYQLEQMWLVDAQTATALPVPSARYSPALFVPGDSTLYMRTYGSTDAEPRLIAIDVAAATQLSDVALPLCDETTVLEGRGCR